MSSRELGHTRAGCISTSPLDSVGPKPSTSLVLNSLGHLSPQERSDSSCFHRHNRAPNRIALQNEDDEEEAVIITTLDTVPFCCHEDLLTMSRHHLIGVARILNARLPKAFRINTDNTDSFIRNSIEILVGIRKGPLMSSSSPLTSQVDKPGNHSQSSIVERGMDIKGSEDGDQWQQQTLLNMSPLATKRARRASVYGSPCVTPRLSRLVEEEEDDDGPFKKRRRISEAGGSRLKTREGFDTGVGTPSMYRSSRPLRGPLDDSPTVMRKALLTCSDRIEMQISTPLYRRNSEAIRSRSGRPPEVRASSLSVTHTPL
ncbi:hypothetical protein E1B28_005820 [Marasmius oreades]|uniref:Uncharacterized protein n=1 Tax=Marasmius oreades TaxID=181124 RepID=A0A9P7UW94_9AGAR|nr:uncharacterized protein E1B28_005820 [Marasmius oreades]KAG7095029.1 hypothetical protein E1B28_005820 [Marasmius oreades]